MSKAKYWWAVRVPKWYIEFGHGEWLDHLAFAVPSPILMSQPVASAVRRDWIQRHGRKERPRLVKFAEVR